MDTKLLRKEEAAEGTMRFHFEKPAGFSFRAGQSIDLTIPNPPETDAEGNTRAFSIVAAPEESELSITTRMRDTAFKRSLKAMPEGAPLTFEGPFGDFTLHEKTSRPAVFLAGGIGVTPFFSMIKDATLRALPHSLTLFYSNRRPEDTAFLKELQDIAAKNPRFTLVATMTEMEKSAEIWEGERGYIDSAMVSRHLPQGEPLFYLAGPASMVSAMRTLLNGMNISNDDIRTEEFTGY